MRLFNWDGRLTAAVHGAHYDVATASEGHFKSDPQAIYDRWSEFVEWTQGADWGAQEKVSVPPAAELRCPVPTPRQIFAVGMNYADHAIESGFAAPTEPVVFAKFASSLTGPVTEVVLPDGCVDWEVELVVVIGTGGRNISLDRGWDHVAGLTIGQDLSERRMQHSGPAPQFSLAKSHAGFSPMGPAVVTLDEIEDPDNLALGCTIDGETVQRGTTADLIFPVPDLVARLSRIVELLPGDLIFTGTPAGVGAGRIPPRYLGPGQVLSSWIDGLGTLEQRLVAGHSASLAEMAM